MDKKVDLVCDYCGVQITEEDHKCPNCGANCTAKINNYKEQQEKLKQDEEQRKIRQSKQIVKDLDRTMAMPIMFFGIAFIFIVIIMVISIASATRKTQDLGIGKTPDEFQEEVKKQVIEVGYNELAKAKDYTFILDSYELYEYASDDFPEHYNTPAGYQKIAFHFRYDNTSNNSYHLGYSAVNLTADDYKVESSDLEVGTFEKVVSGKASYPSFAAQIIRDGEKFQGYVGFLVPKDKKELTFYFEDIKIVMDNPVYQGE